MALILQTHNVAIVQRDRLHVAGAGQQTLGLQLLAAEAHHHDFAAEVGVQRQVMNGADRHHRRRRVNRHAAAVKVVQRHHAIDVRVVRQQIALDNLHDIVHHARHAVHAGGNAEQVARADAAVRVAVAFEGVAFQRRQLGRHISRQRQAGERRRFRQRHQRLVDPAALRDIAQRIADHFAIAENGRALRNGGERHFMPLRHMLRQRQPVGKGRACRQPLVVDHDSDIVIFMDFDIKRRLIENSVHRSPSSHAYASH